MICYKSYRDIPDEDSGEYEACVDACFSELRDIYADEIEEQGMNATQKAYMMARAREMARERMSEE